MRTNVSLLLSACLCGWTVAQSPSSTVSHTSHRSTPAYDDYLTGNAGDVTTRTKGGLQLEGGGPDIPDAFRWLIDHAGGGDIVIIRASGEDGYHPFITGLGQVDSVESIVFHSRDAASDKDVIRTLEHAEAVFIAGGDQSNYVRFWKGTPVEATLNALAKRGVPIGGTSAGLAVMAQFGFSAMHDTITSPEALANPYDDKITIERAFLALPRMTGIITDSHFVARDRLGRLLAFLARMAGDGWVFPARAIAVDEQAALLVEAGGSAAVVGKGPVYFMRTTVKPAVCEPGTPLTMSGVSTYRVPPGGKFDLNTWQGAGGEAYVLSVAAGTVTSSGGRLY